MFNSTLKKLSLVLILVGVIFAVSACDGILDMDTDPEIVEEVNILVNIDEEPLEGVEISLDSNDFEDTTDEDGVVTFTDVEEGTYELEAEKDDYVAIEGTGNVSISPDNAELTVEMIHADDYDDTNSLVILHTNDEHGVIENFGKIAWQKQQYEDEYDDVLLVSGGDAFSGSPIVDEYVIDGENLRGKPMIDTMSAAGYDAMVIGNHEFDYGQERLQASMEDADFPMILANMEVDPTEAYMDEPDSYVSLETDFGAEVSMLGLVQVSGDYPSTLPDNLYGLDFLDPVDTALDYSYLDDDSDLFVGLTHLGHSWDQELAEAMGELDVIVGGHSHTVVDNPEFTNDVLVTQAGDDTTYLGKIEILFDGDNNVISREGELLEVADIEGTDEDVEALITEFEENVEEIFARELNYLEDPISGNDNLGGLMTDAIVESENIEDSYSENIDFSFQNNGGIRVNELEEGPLTVGDIFELEPFGNHVIVYEMSYEDIESLIEYSFNRRGSIDLQVGGLLYDVKVNEIGAAVGAELYDLDGDELDEDETYYVGLNQYIASSYEFEAQDDGQDTYIRANDTIIEFVEDIISQEELNTRYEDLDRTGITNVDGAEGGTEIAETTVDLTTVDAEDSSTTAGNLFADAARTELDVDIGTYPADQFTSDSTIEAGTIYQEALGTLLYDSFGFDNNIVIATVTGADLEQMFLEQADWWSAGAAITQISGAEYDVTVDIADNVHDLEVYIDGDRVESDAEYTVAINSYKWQFYSENIDPIDTETTDRTEEEVLVDYLNEQEIVGDNLEEDRITVEVDEDIDPGDTIVYSPVDISTYDKFLGSVTAGNLITDAVREELELDFATFAGQDLEDDVLIDAGYIFENQIESISFEYDNEVKYVEVTGEEFEAMLHGQNEFIYAQNWADGPVYSQGSGFTQEIEIEDGELVETRVYVDGERVDQDKKYLAGFNSFRYSHYEDEIERELEPETSDRYELDLVLDYLEDIDELDEDLADDRIEVIED